MTEEQKPADGSAARSTEANSQEQSELSRLIQQYEADKGDQVVKALKAVQPAVDYVNEQKTEKAQERFDNMISKATEKMLESEDLAVLKKTAKNPTRLARGYLEDMVREDKDLEAAANRYFKDGDEKAWNSALEKVSSAFVEEFGVLKDLKSRDDAEAAVLATRGQTAKEPPEDKGPSVAEMFAMDDHQWETHMAEERAKASRAARGKRT